MLELIHLTQLGVSLERRVWAREIESIDGAEHVAVLNAQLAEQAGTPNAVDLHAHHAAVLFVTG